MVVNLGYKEAERWDEGDHSTGIQLVSWAVVSGVFIEHEEPRITVDTILCPYISLKAKGNEAGTNLLPWTGTRRMEVKSKDRQQAHFEQREF